MKNAEKLINDVKSKLNKCDGPGSFTLKGVKNLSVSDLDTLQLYAESYNGYGFDGLMEPLGDIKKVLDAYNIK